jgi:flagellin-like protein
MNIRNRKAISPLITTLLLIAIAVAASVLTYSWVMSMVGSQSAQAQTQVRIDSVAWDIQGIAGTPVGNDTVTITIRNTGSIAADIESITIRKNTAGSTAYSRNNAAATGAVDVGLVVTKTWTPTTAAGLTYIINGTAYVVRVTTKTGFYYELVATSPTAP